MRRFFCDMGFIFFYYSLHHFGVPVLIIYLKKGLAFSLLGKGREEMANCAIFFFMGRGGG